MAKLVRFGGIAAAAACLLLAAFAAGCNGAGGASRLGPAVAPSSDPTLARRWYYGWAEQEDVLTDCPVRRISVALTSRGRDWRPPEGPDGYAVRVFLLDHLDRYIRADGTLQAFVVQAPFDPYAKKALYAWSVSADEAAGYFRKDKVAGYLLRLDWGDDPAAPRGTFMLVVRWVSKDGKCRIMAEPLVFEDRIEHEITTTTSRPSQP